MSVDFNPAKTMAHAQMVWTTERVYALRAGQDWIVKPVRTNSIVQCINEAHSCKDFNVMVL